MQLLPAQLLLQLLKPMFCSHLLIDSRQDADSAIGRDTAAFNLPNSTLIQANSKTGYAWIHGACDFYSASRAVVQTARRQLAGGVGMAASRDENGDRKTSLSVHDRGDDVMIVESIESQSPQKSRVLAER
jgi:hypothetical protein